MMRFNKLRRILLTALLATGTAVAVLTSCTKVDDTLGGNLVPDNQQMKTGYVSLPAIDGLNPKRYVETRLYQTDSITASNISYGYFGTERSDLLGLRTAGFLSQYVSYYKVDSGYFGYRPIFDSAQLLLSVKAYGKDTLTAQTFAIYEVISNDYLDKKPIAPGKTARDSVFYQNFRPEDQNMLGEKLFTFTLGGDIKPSTKAVTLETTTAGRDFIARLMLQKGDRKADYSIYSADSLEYWVKEFKGLYICPEKEVSAANSGTIYSTSLEGTGLSIYGRNHVKDDPTLIKDTIGMVYYFYDSYAKHGNVSVNSIRHDYSSATAGIISIDDAKESNKNRPTNSKIVVEGMGGIISELTFTKEFFADLEAQISKENQSSGKDFKTLAFSQVRMSIYFEKSHYDWQQISDITRLTELMDAAPTRLGTYTDYKKLSGISDYAYLYEKNYSTSLTYSGYINRSRGCYVMDITGYMQSLWNSYQKEKARAGSFEQIDWSKVEHRSVYLGPEAYSLYTTSFGTVQGEAPDSGTSGGNNAPIRFDLTYNMIK